MLKHHPTVETPRSQKKISPTEKNKLWAFMDNIQMDKTEPECILEDGNHNVHCIKPLWISILEHRQTTKTYIQHRVAHSTNPYRTQYKNEQHVE